MEKYKRLETLLHRLERKPYSSKQDLLEYFEEVHDTLLSARTLERDFQTLEIDYHIAVKYNRIKNGYHLMTEDNDQITSFLTFAGRVYLAELFRKGLKDFQDLQKSIKLEDHSEFEGLDMVEPIFMAIQQKLMVAFLHENYLKKTMKDYQLAPLQLREYQGRWYVIGVPVSKDHPINADSNIKSFGLARISRLKIIENFTFDEDLFKEQLKKFGQIIGLNYNEAEGREIIEIAVSKTQYKYLESLPLHGSQQKKEEMKDGRIKIRLHLIPNFELKMQILKLGEQIEVLSPAHLRKEIETSLTKSLKQYQDEKDK